MKGRPRVPQTTTGSKATGGWESSFESVFAHPLFLAVVDLFLGLLAYFGAWVVRVSFSLPFTTDLLPQERWNIVSHPWVALILSQLFLLFILGMYDDIRALRYREILGLVSMACLMQVAVITSTFYFAEQPFPRSVILIFDLFNFILICGWRAYVKSRLGARIRRALIVGHRVGATREILNGIEQSPWMGIRVVGLVVNTGGGLKSSSHTAEANFAGYPVLGNLEDLPDIVDREQVEEILFASEPSWRDQVLSSLGRIQDARKLRIAILPSVYDMVIGKLRHINIHDTPLIEVKQNPNEPFERFMKRTFDLIGSALALVLLSPILLIVSLAIKVFTSGPVFYRQQRVGRDRKTFLLFKFRTMVPDAEKHTGATYSTPDDPRVTSVGRILRRTKLDELPQLLNVLVGDMSFVGPRPERPEFVREFLKGVDGYGERLKVKPGITGLAQVRGYYHTKAENKLKYDLAYIYNYSFSLDILILLETLKVLLTRRELLGQMNEETSKSLSPEDAAGKLRRLAGRG